MNYTRNIMLELDDSDPKGRQYLKKNMIIHVIFKTPDEATIASDGLKDINNYGRYINQLETWDPGLKKHLESYFGPSIWSLRNALEKERGEPFPTRTSASRIEQIKKYYENKPSKSIINFTVEGDEILIPLEKNRKPLGEDNIKNILKIVLPTIGLKGYKLKTRPSEEGLNPPKDDVTENKATSNIDLGHPDDEPHMLKSSVYRIAKYAIELYKMLDKYDKSNTEIDFPDWWQEKIHLAKEYLVKAKHYLDFEEKEPSLDSMLGEEMGSTLDQSPEDALDSLIRKYMNSYVANQSDQFTDKYGPDSEKVMYGLSVKRAKEELKNRNIKEKMDPIGQEDDDINNDGKVNKTDSYLLNRRKKIAKNIKK